MPNIGFPSDFLFGVSTSSYQIEGAWNEAGKGESIWDRFAHTPGKISDGSTGDVACDHYHRFAEDVALMREMKVRAYRFSVSWPRVLPEGRGRPNPAGLDFYSRLVDALLDAGILPVLCLFHWDLPQALQEQGGFANRDVTGWFADYAALLAARLGDRVKMWVTMNEPSVYAMLGHATGMLAPGIKDYLTYFKVAHHLNLAHGRAVVAIRDSARAPEVGTVLSLPAIHPRSNTEEDRRAAQVMDGLWNRFHAEPILLGRYPEDLMDRLSALNLPMPAADLAAIRKPLDFLGVNVYTRHFAYHDKNVPLLEAMIDDQFLPRGAAATAMGWEIYPPAIYEMLKRVQTEWGDPVVYVTENGAAFDDVLDGGVVNDPARIDYLKRYLAEVRQAMREGVKVKGYFVWSLLDNFEWAYGFSKRFGLVFTDYPTQRRIPKASAFWYRELIERGSFALE